MDQIDFTSLRELRADDTVNTDSIDSLYRAQRQRNLGFTRRQVAYFLRGQEGYQLALEFKRPKEFSSIVSRAPGEALQADLIFFKKRWRRNERSKFGREPRSVANLLVFLNVVDVHSRKAWSKKLRDKSKEEVTAAFDEILDDIIADGKEVKYLNSDGGREFLNDEFQALLEEQEIKHYVSDKTDFAKNGIVERFNRTMRRKVEIWKRDNPNRNFVNFVTGPLLTQYNDRKHSTIKNTPNSVWDGREQNQQQVKKLQYDFAVGDRVRKIERNALFDKGAFQWSRDVYRIVAAQDVPAGYQYPDADPGTRPRAFVLETTRGQRRRLGRSYLGYELLKITGAQRPAGVEQADVDRRERREARQDRQDRAARRLRREGVDAANVQPQQRRSSRGLRPNDLVGKNIRVTWKQIGANNWSVLDRNTIQQYGTSGTRRFTGRVLSYNPQSKMHSVRFADGTFNLNFMVSTDPDFIQRRYWAFA
eukprot:SAG31_NODE_2480_length_5634_cov_5.818248_2_plen_477_part_00